MRAARAESLSEHTAETAILAHTLALIATNILKDKDLRPETVAVAALYHDASEILTGDMPTPVKYKNPELRRAYKQLEDESAKSLSQLLPKELGPVFLGYLSQNKLNPKEKTLLKAADKLSALIKCIEEERSGNTEFCSAKKGQIELLQGMECPALDYFIEHFLPCYQHNLDELTT